jgi:DNA-binding transcriptional ArsR family regulator
MNESHKIKAQLLKALGHPIRYCIVEGLLNGEQNVLTMTHCVGVPQPTVSQHLNILKAAGIINGERCGNSISYSVCNDEVREIIRLLE